MFSYAMREAAMLMPVEKQTGRSRHITVGDDKAYDAEGWAGFSDCADS